MADSPVSQQSPAPDPRTARTDRKILAGAVKLLREFGPQKVTIEAVAVISGVAKTSIYRRYNNSDELLEAALEHVNTELPPVSPGSGNWEESMRSAIEVLFEDMGKGLVLTLLQDPHSTTSEVLRRKIIGPRMELLRDLLRRDQELGLIRKNVDLDVVIDFMLGASYAHVARYGSLGEAWPSRVHATLANLVAVKPVE
ncbi:TetR/AcrR family transcriptional regulator [Kocuria sp. cx-455]|uniref:TetR/AcrR family transcriptional regulator n=1 Tax=Kocuria sp. cx-455 TaxID=2771377 RepID=UPI0028064DE4|nr:TetR/AcrR family transcriptional regulator [Kocuria sp. cx-455]